MKTKIWITISGVILVAACSAQAVNKDFYSSGQILPGESWTLVNIYNDDTVVDMLGGSADWIGTHDGSTLNVIDGHADIEALDYSSLHISGGDLGIVRASAVAGVTFSDSAVAESIRNANFATTTITGGTTADIRAADSAIVFLYGGTVTDYLSAYDASTINIYGHDLLMTDFGGAYGYGEVSGFLADDTPFTIDLYDTQTYSHINLVPEPGSLALLALGGLMLRRKRFEENM